MCLYADAVVTYTSIDTTTPNSTTIAASMCLTAVFCSTSPALNDVAVVATGNTTTANITTHIIFSLPY